MYTFESRIRYSETDQNGRLTLSALINYFQDCSTFHSEDAGLGIDYLRDRKLVWVLSSWQIVAERYPLLGEKVTVGTQPYDMKGFLGYRNFWMTDAEGRYLAKANSLWSLLNTETARPSQVTQEMVEGYGMGSRLEMDYAPRKIVVPQGGTFREPIVVNSHHLDTNHHVNNQKFVDMAMDLLPDGQAVGQLRAEYKKQAFLNDVLKPYVAEAEGKTVVSLTDEAGQPYMIAEFS